MEENAGEMAGAETVQVMSTNFPDGGEAYAAKSSASVRLGLDAPET